MRPIRAKAVLLDKVLKLLSQQARFSLLKKIQAGIRVCRQCPKVVGPPVHGLPVLSPILLLGQAPGPREASYGRPFAYTAGKTLFRWFETSHGVNEARFRNQIYIAAVIRCYPGKGSSKKISAGGDRIPTALEIKECRNHLQAEIDLLKPKLIIPVGKLAISQVLGSELFHSKALLADVVGLKFKTRFCGHSTEVICLPHPSGLSTWHKKEPGISLLNKALSLIGDHPAWHEALQMSPPFDRLDNPEESRSSNKYHP